MTEEASTNEWTIAKCYRVLRPFQSALGRLAKLYPALRAYPYNEGIFTENSTERARLQQSRQRQIVTYSRKTSNNIKCHKSRYNGIARTTHSQDSKENLLIRNLIQGHDDNGEALRQKTLAVLQRWCSAECYDCIVGIERAFRHLMLILSSSNENNNNNNRVGSRVSESLQRRCALGVGRAIALSAPAAEGEWYTYSETPYLRRWRKTMIAGHTVQLLVNAFCTIPNDTFEEDTYDTNDNDEGILVLGLLNQKAALLVFPLFAVAMQNDLAAQTLVDEYIKVVRTAPQHMTNLWALPAMLRQGLIDFEEMLELAYIVIAAGRTQPCDVHLFLQALILTDNNNNGDYNDNEKANKAGAIVRFLKTCIANHNIAALECIYPLLAYALTHENRLLAVSGMTTAIYLFVESDEDDITLTAQLLVDTPNRLRSLPSADVFECVLIYVLAQQQQYKDFHDVEFDRALQQRLTRVVGLSSEHREFVCTALAKAMRENRDSPYITTETEWVQKLLEKHAMDEFYATGMPALNHCETEIKRKKNNSIGYDKTRGKHGHYTRSKPPPSSPLPLLRRREPDKRWHENLNSRSHTRVSRVQKELPSSMLIISSSGESESDDYSPGPETGPGSSFGGHDTEINFDSSDSDGLIPICSTRSTKLSFCRRAELPTPSTPCSPSSSYYYESETSHSLEHHGTAPLPANAPTESDSDDNSEDDLMLLHNSHSKKLTASSQPQRMHQTLFMRRRQRQSPDRRESKRARLNYNSYSSSEDDDDLLMI